MNEDKRVRQETSDKIYKRKAKRECPDASRTKSARLGFSCVLPKMAHTVKIPFIVFHLARLIFTGQASHLDMICP